MKIATLKKLFEQERTNELEWKGLCHDCKKDIVVIARQLEDEITIEGGALYEGDATEPEDYYLKCDRCFQTNPTLTNFQPVECYSRVVGYMRPINSWNGAKRAEFDIRKPYNIEKSTASQCVI